MSTYRDVAVIIRKLDYGEADRIYTLLMREHGKVGAIARGVRRTRSKLAPSLQLYSQVDVLLARGRNLDIVTQVMRLPGPRLEADLDRTAFASLIAEIADRVSEDRHPLEGLYDLTAGALDDLAREDDPRRGSTRFLMGALDLLGYAPQLGVCASCERALAPEPAAFSAAAGGFLCGQCADPAWRTVSLTGIKVLRVLQSGDRALYHRLKLDADLLAEVEEVLEAQLEHHLDRRLNSLRFLRQMRGAIA